MLGRSCFQCTKKERVYQGNSQDPSKLTSLRPPGPFEMPAEGCYTDPFRTTAGR